MMPAALAAQPVLQRSLLDRAIEYLSPVRGQQRLAARMRLTHTRAYLAGAQEPWKPKRGAASGNADHMADGKALREKSRFLIQNVEYIAAGMNARVSLTVGTGIIPKWGGRDGARLKALWDAWAPLADADGVWDIYGLQAMAARTLDADGEVLIRLRNRLPQDGLPVPLQLQVLEVDWLDNIRTGNPDNGNAIVQGKEYDALGKCVAYWLWDAHPGDTGLRKTLRTQSRRVPATSIIHLYAPGRPGQARGFPRLAPVIPRARDLQLLEDAELQRKNLEGRLSVLASGSAEMLANPHNDGSAPSFAAGELGQLGSGGITQVPPGLDLTVVQPKAAPGFVDYCKYNIHLIAAGAGFTYEQATGDLTAVNFSSMRGGQLNQRREIEQLQWLTLVPMLCNRVCREFAVYAGIAGKLGGQQPSYTLEHSTPKWDYTNPVDEVAATLDEIGGGLTSYSEAMRRRGDDPEVRVQELADDIKRFKTLGIWEDIVQLTTGVKPQAAEAPAVAPKPSPAPAPAKA